MLRMRFLPLLLVLLLTGQTNAASKNIAQDQYNELKALVGTWKEKGSKASDFEIQFELIANDTVLIEKWLYGGKTHSQTVYHMDNGDLLATHYCPQGNQPRLKLQPSNNKKVLKFDFKDATNLNKVKQSYQVRLEFNTSDLENVLLRSEVYQNHGQSEPSVLSLIKKRN